MLKISRMNFTKAYQHIPQISRYQSTRYQPNQYIRRHGSTVSQLRSIDMLPSYELEPEKMADLLFDSKATMFSDLYEKAKQFDAETPMLRINAFGQESVALFSHDLVKQLQQYELYGQTKRTIPPPFTKIIGKFFVELYGKQHLEWRKKISKSFKPHIIDKYAPFIHESANKLVFEGIFNICKDSDQTFVDFYPLARQFAFEVGMKFVWGPLLTNSDLETTFDLFTAMIKGLMPDAIANDPQGKDPNSDFSKALKYKQELQNYLLPYYNNAVELTENKEWDIKYTNCDCLIKGMMENDAVYDDGSYTIYDKIDQMILLTFAAFETSALSLNILIYNIWKYPKQAQKVGKAIMNHPKLSNINTTLTLSVLNECQELDIFVKESQRMYNLVPSFLRQVNTSKGLQFGKYLLPDQTAITIPISWLHKGEGSWSNNKLIFDPSRFDKSNGRNKEERGDIGRYNNIPFAFGLHKCLGMYLSQLEMKMYTTLLLRDWEFQLDETKFDDCDDEEKGKVINQMKMKPVPHYNVHLKLNKKM